MTGIEFQDTPADPRKYLPPAPDDSLEEIAEEQGWTDTTLLGVLIDWIDNHADKSAAVAYARQRAEQENQEAETAWP